MDLSLLPRKVPVENDWFGNVAIWHKFKVDISTTGNVNVTQPDGTVTPLALPAGLTQDVVLIGLPPGAMVEGVRIKTRTASAGTATLTAQIGVAGADTLFLSAAFDLTAAPSATNFAPLTTFGNTVGNNTTAAINLVVLLTATVNNLSLLTAMSFDVWVKIATLI